MQHANLRQPLKFTYQKCTALEQAQAIGPMVRGDVHIYHGRLDTKLNIEAGADAVLSAEERLRASRFHFDKNRNEYVITRSALRKLLGYYLNLPADQLQFLYTQHGKPYIAGSPIAFNVSHTHGMAALAFTMQRSVGIDVEAVRTNFRADDIAERFFSERERQSLRKYSNEGRHAAFFRCWTRKEAYIKAHGEGLSHPLAQFDVDLDPESESSLIATRPDPLETERWILRPFPVPDGFQAAVAVALDLP